MRKILSIIAIIVFLPAMSWAAGSAVFSFQIAPDGKSVELTWVCTSDAAAGTVSSPTLTQPGSTNPYKYNSLFTGTIGTATITPGAGGVQPTTLFDVELRDTAVSGIDYLGGMGDNLANDATKIGTPLDEVSGVTFDIINRGLTPYASGCGNSKQFTLKVIVHFKE